MTDLKTLVQAFLDADDEFVAAHKAYHSVGGGWPAVWKARDVRDVANLKRDAAYAAVDLLNAWASKAVCFHSQRTADKLWRELNPSLTRSERDALLCAWSHARIGEKDEVFWVRDQVLRGRQAQ